MHVTSWEKKHVQHDDMSQISPLSHSSRTITFVTRQYHLAGCSSGCLKYLIGNCQCKMSVYLQIWRPQNLFAFLLNIHPFQGRWLGRYSGHIWVDTACSESRRQMDVFYENRSFSHPDHPNFHDFHRVWNHEIFTIHFGGPTQTPIFWLDTPNSVHPFFSPTETLGGHVSARSSRQAPTACLVGTKVCDVGRLR